MTATVLAETPLPGLPSASGVEIVGPTAYVVSDDSAFLYCLDAATLVETGRVPLFAIADAVNGRLPKPTKPDVECLTALDWPGRGPGLLLLGSGSLPTRERGWWLPAGSLVPEALSLSPLYALLRPLLPPGTVLNLEAAATVEEAGQPQLLLFQRGLASAAAGAVLFVLPLLQVLAYLQSNGRPPAPPVRQLPFQLPALNGQRAGFSGASAVGGRLFVSAAVEDTADAVLDGAVLGSFVGVLDLAAGTAAVAPLHWPDGRPYLGKVEGIAVRRPLGPGRFELLLVTDDDAGGSTALLARYEV